MYQLQLYRIDYVLLVGVTAGSTWTRYFYAADEETAHETKNKLLANKPLDQESVRLTALTAPAPRNRGPLSPSMDYHEKSFML